ncbi:hypothetical protein UlMin_005600 [Ulmus minor]
MMAQKQLLELLKEDQEPFLLQDYIAERKPKTHLQVKKRKPISETKNFPGNFCKNACFFSFQESPDLRKSPLFEFPSPAAKSPCKSPNAIFLHIPARTAALLLDAALRIQKHSSSKPKTQNKNHSFGLFGSLLKRLTHRSRKREIQGNGVKVSVKDILRWDSSVGRRNNLSGEKQSVSPETMVDSSRPCTGRPSSTDLETSTSSDQCEELEEIDFVTNLIKEGSFCEENDFCQSPFHFVLQRTPPSPGRRTPEFRSPAASPCRHKQEDKENCDLKKELQEEEEEEEEKEQFSPVSVLDPPFDDDYDGREEDEDDGFDLESSYAIVQRTKHQLLQKLRRFEKLAELDPIELEKRMLEDDDDEDYDFDNLEEEEECEADDTSSIDGFVQEVLGTSSIDQFQPTPEDMKRLVSDLIVEEGEEQNAIGNGEEVARRVCKRFESWNEVQSNTIDMMVEQDFRKELEGWKKNQEQVGETAIEIELAIFGLLVGELASELVCLSGN